MADNFKDWLDELKAKINIVDVVESYLEQCNDIFQKRREHGSEQAQA